MDKPTDPVEAARQAAEDVYLREAGGVKERAMDRATRAAIRAYREALEANDRRVVYKQHLLDAAKAVRGLYSIKTAKDDPYSEHLRLLYNDLYTYAAPTPEDRNDD